MKKQQKKIKLLLIIGIFIIINLKFGQVLALGELTEFIISPSIEQTETIYYGPEDHSWPASEQKRVYDVWVAQGKTIDEHGWAYITVNNEKRFFIALAMAFGNVGDYIDLYVEDGVGEKLVTCIKAEAKSEKDEPGNGLNDGAYFIGNDHIGHKYGTKCSILEIQLKDDSYWEQWTPSMRRSLVPVRRILVRGNYFEHPEGPLDTTQTRTVGSGYSGNTGSGLFPKKSDDDTSLLGILGDFLSEIVDSLATVIDNLITGGNESSVLIAQSDNAGEGSGASPAVPSVGNANLMITCRELALYLMNKGAVYQSDYSLLTYGNIEKNYTYPEHDIVCATYVSIALWKSGLLDLDTINRSGYNAADGVAIMVENNGWRKIKLGEGEYKDKTQWEESDLQEGDILVYPKTHVSISAGGWKVWEESCGCVSSTGAAPTGETHTYSQSYASNFDIYRRN